MKNFTILYINITIISSSSGSGNDIVDVESSER